jgi:hypothetical protein
MIAFILHPSSLIPNPVAFTSHISEVETTPQPCESSYLKWSRRRIKYLNDDRRKNDTPRPYSCLSRKLLLRLSVVNNPQSR